MALTLAPPGADKEEEEDETEGEEAEEAEEGAAEQATVSAPQAHYAFLRKRRRWREITTHCTMTVL